MSKREAKGRERREPDYILLLVVSTLVLLGLLMVYSTTFDWGYLESGNPFQFISRQVLWLALGVGVAIGLAHLDYGYWQRLAVPLLFGTLVMLVVLLLVGDLLWGARRSMFGGSVQPGELAKLVTVIYAATWVASKEEQIRDLTYGLLPFAVWMGMVAGLVVLQPDLSAAAILVIVGFTVFFLAGAHIGQMLLAGTVGTAVFSAMVLLYPYASSRITDFVLSLRDPTQLTYHPRQALYALANGGLLGTGLGEGYSKFGYLPTAHTDTIFAALGEEMGFVGCLLVIALFGLLAWRGFRIALKAPDRFGSLLACGLTCLLVVQAVLNVAVALSLLPFTGTPLPFISLGGSSLEVSLAAVGILLSISRGRIPQRWRANARVDRGGRDGGPRLSWPGRPAGA